MNLFTEGQISELCYAVEKGKFIASMPIKTIEIDKYINIITTHKLKTYITSSTDEWSDLYIYDKELALEIIKNLPHNPKTIFDHWVLGKAYGYSDEAIEKFIKTF